MSTIWYPKSKSKTTSSKSIISKQIIENHCIHLHTHTQKAFHFLVLVSSDTVFFSSWSSYYTFPFSISYIVDSFNINYFQFIACIFQDLKPSKSFQKVFNRYLIMPFASFLIIFKINFYSLYQ